MTGTSAPRAVRPASARIVPPLIAALAALVALAYLLPFRGYALQVEDEGVFLYQLLRVVEGQIPYVDFLTGYTLGYFYLAAPLLGMLGDVATFRIAIHVVHAATVVGLALLACRVARPSLALVIPLVYVAFIPVYPGSFCAFNIPYPAWFATFGWVATALALVAFVERRRRGLLVAAGAGAAFTFAMKPNAGLFALAAAAAVVLLVEPRRERASAVARVAWWTLWIGVLGGVIVTIGRPRPLDALVYYGPVAGVMLAIAARRSARERLVGDAAVLLGTFAALTLPWMAALLSRLEPERFFREVLYIGSNAAEVFYTAYPVVTPWAWVVTALVLGFAVLGALARRGVIPPRAALLAIALAAVGGALAAGWLGVMPERFSWSVVWQLERAAFSVTLAVEAAGIVWLWRARRTPENEVPTTVLVCATFMHLQLYPRADFMHLVSSATLASIFAAFLLDRVCRWWEAALRRSGAAVLARAVSPAIVALFCLAVAIRVAPTLRVLAVPARYTMPFANAPLWIEAERSADARALSAAALRLRAHGAAGAPSFGFPSIEAVLVLSGLRNPTRYTYMVPGRPDHLEEASMVDALTAPAAPALVSLNRDFTFFDAAPSYFFMLRDLARSRYVLDARRERYDVLRRRDLPAAAADDATAPPEAADIGSGSDGDVAAPCARLAGAADVGARLEAIAVLGHGRGETVATALLAEAVHDDATVRSAALRALLAVLARDPERGLESYVDAAGLDRRRETLLLRTVRDTREERAASYLFAAAGRDDPLIANEARGAMLVTRASMIARSNLWAGPEEAATWPGRATLVGAVTRTAADGIRSGEVAAFAAELAGRLGVGDAVPALRAGLDGSGPVAASSARSLAILAPADLACRLVELLETRHAEVDVQEVVPSVLLELARAPDPIGAEARSCLRSALARGGVAQEDAVWITAALGDARFVPQIHAMIASATLPVQRAAVWALGELASDADSRALLANAATIAVDPVIRALAAGAAAKVAGAVPRALGPSGANAGHAAVAR